MLLKEIHHRVKNNLQLISSLLAIQSKHITQKREQELFEIARDRIRSIALVHEKIYGSENLSNVNFANYIQDIIHHLNVVYADDDHQIHYKLDLSPVTLEINQAVYCGLVVNEVISNIYKHAFPDNSQPDPEITIVLKEDNERSVRLCISDNGIGMPEGMAEEHNDTLGVKLIHMLIKDQLKGDVITVSDKGMMFDIRFKI